MTTALHHLTATALLATATLFSLGSAQAQSSPATATTELVFSNPTLKSGMSKQPGAIYRFTNVAPGVDAEILLRKFSRPDIFIEDIDVAEIGFDKAFQPKFGINKAVAANQNWYIDFKLNFYKAGTTTPITMAKLSFTALDIDGDNHTIQEYNQFNNASGKQYASNTLLTDSATVAPGFNSGGVSNQNFNCSLCGASGKITRCKNCSGTGVDASNNQCAVCAGSGSIFKDCTHPFVSVSQARGSIKDFNSANGIDTMSTQVMVTYTYLNKNEISFRYGATTAATAVTSTAVRLNSMWAKSFNLAPVASVVSSLPVSFFSFTTQYTGGDVVVRWHCAEEMTLSHFVVQRSGDGKTFRDVAMVFAANMGGYSYKDKNLRADGEVVYYRVLAVEKTGEVSAATQLSLVRLSNSMPAAAVLISAFPNPAAGEIRVSFPATWAAKEVSLQLYTTGGVALQTTRYKKGGQSQSLNLASLTSGTYIVKASCNSESAQQIITKL